MQNGTTGSSTQRSARCSRGYLTPLPGSAPSTWIAQPHIESLQEKPLSISIIRLKGELPSSPFFLVCKRIVEKALRLAFLLQEPRTTRDPSPTKNSTSSLLQTQKPRRSLRVELIQRVGKSAAPLFGTRN